MSKIIHYCWFGDKKLDKLALKCIKSWKKFLPDYEIMLWNEKNFDVNSTPFSKKAYEEGKWAFVSDVARIYALREYGGIYFDTDMMITKDVSEIVDCEFFAGWETKYNVAVGVLGVKEKNHPIIEKLYKFYSTTEFDIDNTYGQTIPLLLTKALKSSYQLKNDHLNNQYLKDGVVIYANDYFYPITADRSKDMFTDNTCMIHYYNGSWLTKQQRHINKVYAFLGLRLANTYYDWKYSLKTFIKTSIRLFLYPVVKYRRDKIMQANRNEMLEDFKEAYSKINKKDYIVFYNKNWFGTSIATKELFDCVCGIDELSEEDVVDYIADTLIKDNYRLIAFSAFSLGWDKLIEALRKKGYKNTIKVIWHGSNCMNIEDYDWTVFSYIMEALKNGDINRVAFVKKSMYEFYKTKGYDVEFIMNTLTIDEEIKDKAKHQKNSDEGNKTRVGVYASGDRWVKNFYNQLCGASMVENVEVECSPLNAKTQDFASLIGLDIVGSSKPVKRDQLLVMMSKNDVNLYATFTECAPLIPLESFEMGVPCITSNNHHYWEGHPLRELIVVNENDDVTKIHEKIEYCLANKDLILNLYKEWKKEYDVSALQSVKDFLNNC